LSFSSDGPAGELFQDGASVNRAVDGYPVSDAELEQMLGLNVVDRAASASSEKPSRRSPATLPLCLTKSREAEVFAQYQADQLMCAGDACRAVGSLYIREKVAEMQLERRQCEALN
jgi:hypothetical protein